ncbi:MAG TPA: MFS transporter [Candidatus Sulfotelmatobacter sp.]|jgi:OPA family glycerol-3-phosphate transporter-like MFS transporter|nr:MFS transporter [Candidatus Sulfotelmatobacter sp.]
MDFITFTLDHYANAIVGLCLATVIVFYFRTNPLRHGSWFVLRRFINWFPLGMTYSFLYMGRYNLNVSKNALGSLMTNQQFANIFTIGTAVYAFSFLINGPLVDKIGGKRGILIAALGASVANILLGVLTYYVVLGKVKANLVPAYSVLYALNMYFQSYGAVSIIKVKAYWFHVRERGVFGAIFGALISVGIYFAFDWGGRIVELTKAGSTGGWFHDLLQKIFATSATVDGHAVDATWAVFFIPAIIMLVWVVLDLWLIKDSPEHAGFPNLDTHDASSGRMHIELTTLDLLKKVFASKMMLLIALIGLTSGIFRNGIQNWYYIFSHEVKQPGAEFFNSHWGLLICIFGIVGGFLGGWISDNLFQSRRAPPAAILSALVVGLTICMAACLVSAPLFLGLCCVLVVMASVGLTSLMAGTAATDFGGRKATATCSGIVDGCTYLGSAIQSFFIGHLVPNDKPGEAATFLGLNRDWHSWPLFMIPFALLGLIIAIKLWHNLPEATRRFNQQANLKDAPAVS